MDAYLSSISVVIRTKNSAATLEQVTKRLGLRLNDELIIVDSGSTDNTLNIAKSAGARIVDISKDPFSYGRSLNAGFTLACNSWVLSLSSHCIPVISDLLNQYRHILPRVPAEVACITGLVIGRKDKIKAQHRLEICTPSDFKTDKYFTCINPNSLYRKSFWLIHPFDEKIETAEDLEWSLWALKHGLSLMRWEAATVLYCSRLSCVKMIKKGYIEALVEKRLISSPPILMTQVVKETFWQFAALLRRRASVGFVIRRICYLMGAFWGRRELKSTTSPKRICT